MPTPSGLSSLGLDISLINQYITYPGGGRLTHFVSNWRKITQDPWILQTVQGLRLEFINLPPNLQIRQPVLEADKVQALSREVEKLVQKEAICPVQAGDIGFMSPIFVVPKSDGSWRPVINLKSLNQYVRAPHFKMESIKLVKGLIQEGDWLTKLDLKDAYLTLPVYQAHQKYLRFQWQDQQWQFKVLPFGLNSAPYTFTKLMKPVVALLRRLGIQIILYLDDMLLMAEAESEARGDFNTAVFLLTSLGFIVNMEKSIGSPSQQIVFLGFKVDSRKMTIALPTQKLVSL